MTAQLISLAVILVCVGVAVWCMLHKPQPPVTTVPRVRQVLRSRTMGFRARGRF